jgi:hypothetical protein
VTLLEGVLDFLRLEFDDLDVTLEAARLPRHVAEPIEAGEVGLEAKTFDRKLCVALLESTGAPSIGNHADALVEIASDMTAHLGADR